MPVHMGQSCGCYLKPHGLIANLIYSPWLRWSLLQCMFAILNKSPTLLLVSWLWDLLCILWTDECAGSRAEETSAAAQGSVMPVQCLGRAATLSCEEQQWSPGEPGDISDQDLLIIISSDHQLSLGASSVTSEYQENCSGAQSQGNIRGRVTVIRTLLIIPVLFVLCSSSVALLKTT